MSKKVTFCTKPPIVILEPYHQADALKEARKSDFMQRQADKCRLHRMLIHVFNPEHREQMRMYLREQGREVNHDYQD